MIIEQVFVIFVGIVTAGVLLAVFREDWYSNYLIFLALIIALPIVILVVGFSILRELIKLLWNISRISLKAIVKWIVVVAVGAFFCFMIGISYFVPYLGRTIQRLDRWLEQYIDISGLIAECQYARQMMVEIVTEQDNRSPKYESENQYREELVEIKESGKKRLSLGEWALSSLIGGGLLLLQLSGAHLLQSRIFGVTVALAVQAGLFIIAVSILYRVLVLDFLAYSGDEEFSSIHEMDVACSYQKAVSGTEFVQFLSFMVVIGIWASNVDREIIKVILDFSQGKDTSPLESVKFAWGLLRSENSDQE